MFSRLFLQQSVPVEELEKFTFTSHPSMNSLLSGSEIIL
jgi:hypothetical protein